MNRIYELTLEAESDLIGIWLFGETRWGEARADRYQDELHDCFQRLADGFVKPRSVEGLETVRFCHHQKHFVFFVEQVDMIVIIAVLHERMDLPTQLSKRLKYQQQ